MPAAPAKKKDSGGAKQGVKVEVILDVPDAKKGSVKFTTEARPAAITNIYLSKEAHVALGSPEAVKVTIEPHG